MCDSPQIGQSPLYPISVIVPESMACCLGFINPCSLVYLMRRHILTEISMATEQGVRVTFQLSLFPNDVSLISWDQIQITFPSIPFSERKNPQDWVPYKLHCHSEVTLSNTINLQWLEKLLLECQQSILNWFNFHLPRFVQIQSWNKIKWAEIALQAFLGLEP